MRLIEGNAKCCHLKNLTCKGPLRQVFICMRPITPCIPPPPLHTVNVFTAYLFIHGSGGGGERVEQGDKLEEQRLTKLAENTNMTDCISRL
jgi:hypothetical protein